ncbi:MAG: SLBB domain-containing protein, partial [Longimicrobiales bacterium]
RLSVPALGELELPDSLSPGRDSPVVDTAGISRPAPGLQIFGKSLFERASTQFRPVTMGPVPSNYRLGPGDELILILTGDVQEIYTLPVTREGYVVVPNVGRVSVNGLTLDQLRNALYTYLGRVYSGVMRGQEATTFFDVSIATLRRNQVFVIGEVERPGAYEVTSVSTALDALYQAGGPTEHGSFRSIQIRRGSRVVANLDIYEYLTRGAAIGDISLNQGDVVFVSVRGRRVKIDGNVVRPGIYELKGDEGLRALMELAGGIEPEADLRRLQVDRILPLEERRPGVHRTLFDVDVGELLDREGEFLPLAPGDQVYVFALSEQRRNTVTVRGNVWAPGVYELSPRMRLSQLIDRAGGLRDDTYLGRAQIIRLNPNDLSRRVVPTSLAGGDDPRLEEYDEVVVFSVAEFRDRRFVTIYGSVQNPGVYEFREDMSLRDLIMVAGGLRDGAYVLEAEVARITVKPDVTGDLTDIIRVPLDSSYVISEWADGNAFGANGSSDGNDGHGPGSLSRDFALERYDNVFIRRRPGWELQRTIILTGEVRFPGTYALERKGERLHDLIERAGGLTPEGYAAGIRFFRLLEGAANADMRLEDESADNTAREKRLEGRGIAPVEAKRARVNVDLTAVIEDPSDRDNIVLMDSDSIHIPEFIPSVRVEGAVLFPVTVMFEPGRGMGYYIASAGGYARDADKGRSRVEYPNGSVRTVSRFLFFKSKPSPEPGSRIFVPVRLPGEGTDWGAVIRDSLGILTGFATIYVLITRA